MTGQGGGGGDCVAVPHRREERRVAIGGNRTQVIKQSRRNGYGWRGRYKDFKYGMVRILREIGGRLFTRLLLCLYSMGQTVYQLVQIQTKAQLLKDCISFTQFFLPTPQF